MPTPPDPNERPSAAKSAVPGSSSDPAREKPPTPHVTDPHELTGELPLPAARSGSTDSHKPGTGNSDFFLKGSSAKHKSPESDIAQFLAHPQAVVDNTDDSPTVITQANGQGSANQQQQPKPLPIIVTGGVPSIAGRRLGHFELIEAVGAGGMAAVLRARDTELGRIVALKILPPDAARDQESVNRFKQEARAAAALDHENIARVYYCGEDQGLHFIAFEFVEGINLRQMIDRRGVLPAAECIGYMMQVAAGLNHAAERSVVHRDIKPSNILITPDGRAKIVDMGLARHLGSELVNGGVTQSGVTLGTFDYISPEQALDPRRADVRSDIYSLGCTFYHALTGQPPVPEGTAARKLRAHQNDQPLDPRELNPAIPDELAAVLARMMAKDPAARYQSPMELIAHLKGLAERLNLGTDALAYDNAAQAVPADTRLLPSVPRFHPAWVLACAAVACAAVAFVVATSNPGSAPGGLPGPEVKADPTPGGPTPKGPQPGPSETATNKPVQTVEELAQRLEDRNAIGKVFLEPGIFDLTTLDRPVEFHGKSLELVGAPGGATRIITTASEKPPGGDKPEAPGSLTIKASVSVVVRNVWFDSKLDPKIARGGVEENGVTKPAGVRIEDASKVDFYDCVFAATDPALKDHDPRSVVITREGGCQVSLLRCLFAPNGDGIVLSPGSTVNATDSGFGPHAAVFFVTTDNPEPPPTRFNFNHCSFMLDPRGSIVETGPPPSAPGSPAPGTGAPAPVRVTATDCVFAPVGPRDPDSPIRMRFSASDANKNGVVIRTRGESTEGIEFHSPASHVNVFYHVDPLGTSNRTYSFAECKTEAPEVKDAGCEELKQRPWFEADPLAVIASESPWKSFKLKVEGPDADPKVFTQETISGGKRWVPLGVAFYNPAENNARRAYPGVIWASISPPKKVEARKKIWWPTAEDKDLSPLVSRNLAALLDDVRPGEEILIRHNGEWRCDTIELKPRTKPSDGDFRVVIRADAGFRPILVVDPDNQIDQTLFKLIGGEATFEGIHFLLKPDQPKAAQTVAAVAMLGGRSCTFSHCVFTLAEEDDSLVAAVHLPNIRNGMAMMTPTAKQAPKVVFDHCLIRGKGRAVWTQVSRPVALKMTDTLTALDGPVFFAEAGGKVDAIQTSSAEFTRVTALAGGPVIEMRGSKTNDAPRTGGLTGLSVDLDSCLFVAVPAAGRPLLDIEGIDPSDWKTVLNWRTNKGNRYANFEASAPLAVIRPTGDGAIKEWSREQWIDAVAEPLPPEGAKRFGEIKFAAQVTGLKDLAAVKPADVVVKSLEFADLTGGATLEVGVKPNDLADKLKPLLSEMKSE